MVRGVETGAHQGDRSEAGRLLALGSVVPGVVHELNNALLGLLGMLELAQADATGPVADRLGIAQQAGGEIREIARILGALARAARSGRGRSPGSARASGARASASRSTAATRTRRRSPERRSRWRAA